MSLVESQMGEQRAKMVEADIRIGSALDNALESPLDPAHGEIPPFPTSSHLIRCNLSTEIGSSSATTGRLAGKFPYNC